MKSLGIKFGLNFGILLVGLLGSFSAAAHTNFVCRAFDGRYFFNAVGADKQSTIDLAVETCEQHGVNSAACRAESSIVCKAVPEPQAAKLHLISIVDTETNVRHAGHAPQRRRPQPTRHRPSSGGNGDGESAACWAGHVTVIVRCESNLKDKGIDGSTASDICAATYPARCN